MQYFSDWDDLDQDEYDYAVRRFARPGSALWPATPDNPRNLRCPNCNKPNKLTPKDVAANYQCDECADRAERGYD